MARRQGEFADKFNSMPKFVVSTTLKNPEWTNTTVLDSGDATEQVRKLKDEFDGELQVPGSHRLVQELLESDLVDQLNLMVFPVILGRQAGARGNPRTPQAPAEGVEGRRGRRPRADLRAGRLTVTPATASHSLVMSCLQHRVVVSVFAWRMARADRQTRGVKDAALSIEVQLHAGDGPG